MVVDRGRAVVRRADPLSWGVRLRLRRTSARCAHLGRRGVVPGSTSRIPNQDVPEIKNLEFGMWYRGSRFGCGGAA